MGELPDGQATIWCKNIPEKLNLLSRGARTSQMTERKTDGFAMPLAKSRLANTSFADVVSSSCDIANSQTKAKYISGVMPILS